MNDAEFKYGYSNINLNISVEGHVRDEGHLISDSNVHFRRITEFISSGSYTRFKFNSKMIQLFPEDLTTAD